MFEHCGDRVMEATQHPLEARDSDPVLQNQVLMQFAKWYYDPSAVIQHRTLHQVVWTKQRA